MKDVKFANQVLNSISKNNSNFSKIEPSDKELFDRYFKNERHTYGNSWVYLLQNMYGIGDNNLGFKYYDGENLSAVCVYPKIEEPSTLVFYWIRPMGKNIIKVLIEQSKIIKDRFNLPVVVTKIFPDQADELIKSQSFGSIENFIWHSSAPAEDDTYPEIITDVKETLSNASKKDSIKKALKQYEKINKKVKVLDVNTDKYEEEAWSIAKKFFKQSITSLSHNISTEFDYYNIIFNRPKLDKNYYLKLIVHENNPVGFFDIYLMDEKYACTYASLMLREKIPNLDDFATIYTCKLLDETGHRYLNVGGSETEGLNYFKNKFQVHSVNTMNWVVLV